MVGTEERGLAGLAEDLVSWLVPEPANSAGKSRALFGADGVAPPRNIWI
jgi:hypothetical protein